jgi:hypothetical protein
MMREKLPNRRAAERIKFQVHGINYIAGLGYFPDGRLGEVFLNSEKVGTTADILARDAAIAISFALQHGVTVEIIRNAFTRDEQGNAEGPLGVLFDMLAGGSL